MNDAALPERESDRVAVRDVYVLPGEVAVAREPTRFLTILGSCVSICLYDRARGVGGINHYLLPGSAPAGERDPTRWSAEAIAALFERVLAAGARPGGLEAKVFGGARIGAREVPDAMRIGERNVEEALRALAARRVTVANHDTGGDTGRKLVFESCTGVVWVKQLKNAHAPRVPTRKE